MKNSKKVVRGDVFIIPNVCDQFMCFSPDSQEWIKEKHKRLTGIEPKDEDSMVQVWITSDQCDNWQDRFAGFQKMIGLLKTGEDEIIWEDKRGREARLLGYFPGYFPSRIFKGKKEGDIVKIGCPEYDVIIELTCKQLDYRYRDFGRFEEAFKYVLGED